MSLFILARYGKDAFEIEDSYILITIPYDSAVLEELSGKHNVGLNVGTNVGLNTTEKKTLEILLSNPDEIAENIATSMGVTKRTIERNLKKLQEKGFLVRSGSRKTGKWIVIK